MKNTSYAKTYHITHVPLVRKYRPLSYVSHEKSKLGCRNGAHTISAKGVAFNAALQCRVSFKQRWPKLSGIGAGARQNYRGLVLALARCGIGAQDLFGKGFEHGSKIRPET